MRFPTSMRAMVAVWGLGLAVAMAVAPGELRAEDEPEGVPDFARERPAIETGEPILEFNGENLDGFYTFLTNNKYEDPLGVFTIHDGLLRISGEEYGALTTNDEYSDYHLIIEWKWGEETFPPRKEQARDSGIMLHCLGEDGAVGGHWMESIECQIIEGGCGDFIVVNANVHKPSLTVETRTGPDGQLYYHKGGTPVTRNSGLIGWWGRDPNWEDVLGFRGARDVESPAGEWTVMEVICDGDTIVNIVNGYVVNVGTQASPTKGKIQIQSEGAEMFVRKIEVRPLVK